MGETARKLRQHCQLTIWQYWLTWQIVSDDKIQITILILRRGALSTPSHPKFGFKLCFVVEFLDYLLLLETEAEKFLYFCLDDNGRKSGPHPLFENIYFFIPTQEDSTHLDLFFGNYCVIHSHLEWVRWMLVCLHEIPNNILMTFQFVQSLKCHAHCLILFQSAF